MNNDIGHTNPNIDASLSELAYMNKTPVITDMTKYPMIQQIIIHHILCPFYLIHYKESCYLHKLL